MKKTLASLLIAFVGATLLPAQPAPADLASISRIRTGVKTKRVSSADPTGGNGDNISGIAPGETRVIADIKGAGVINHIWVTIAPRPDKLSRSDIILRMYWDGNQEPSINSPIGPFFGQGWNESYVFISAPLAAAPGSSSPTSGTGGGAAMTSYFSMPFARGARIEIENQSDLKIDAFYVSVDYTEMEKLPEDAGRFHAWFNREVTEADPVVGENEWTTFAPFGKNPTGERNYLVADIKGRGHFVGLNYYVHSPSPMWYGEGDEMIFIDGDTKPTLVGTGTEDYFNTAWCPKEVYMHPYFGLARVNRDIGWLGRTHCYRFHLADPVYFDKSLRFTIEHGHDNVLTLDLATVAYWYQSEATGVPPIPDKAARAFMPNITDQDIHRWRGAWRKQMSDGPKLWGKEKPEAKKP